jgi:D-tyrosyl-tRNA(Tyr) deacylase
MRALVQRVREARVAVDGAVVAAIGPGLLVLVGIAPDDDDTDRDWLVRKLAELRIFDDDDGAMNRALSQSGGEALAVPQFTLYASTRKGNRPSWSGAAAPDAARPRFDAFADALAARLDRPVPRGVFGARMQVSLVNDGPVTIWLDSRSRD